MFEEARLVAVFEFVGVVAAVIFQEVAHVDFLVLAVQVVLDVAGAICLFALDQFL